MGIYPHLLRLIGPLFALFGQAMAAHIAREEKVGMGRSAVAANPCLGSILAAEEESYHNRKTCLAAKDKLEGEERSLIRI
eukprot:2918868-Pyramimonas_sp.AAC.2